MFLVALARICQLHPCNLWEYARRFRRSARTICGVTPPNSYDKYCIIPDYTWNQILKVYLYLFQMQTFQKRSDQNSGDLLERKYLNIISQNMMDIGRTNLIELDIPMEGLPIASKLYMVPLKYCEFVDHEIKQLEEVGIIS